MARIGPADLVGRKVDLIMGETSRLRP